MLPLCILYSALTIAPRRSLAADELTEDENDDDEVDVLLQEFLLVLVV